MSLISLLPSVLSPTADSFSSSPLQCNSSPNLTWQQPLAQSLSWKYCLHLASKTSPSPGFSPSLSIPSESLLLLLLIFKRWNSFRLNPQTPPSTSTHSLQDPIQPQGFKPIYHWWPPTLYLQPRSLPLNSRLTSIQLSPQYLHQDFWETSQTPFIQTELLILPCHLFCQQPAPHLTWGQLHSSSCSDNILQSHH